MSWEKVSETTNGYRKYRDENGNLRYMDPDGKFTSQNAWAGAQSQTTVQEVPEFEQTPGVTLTDVETTFKRSHELEGYDSMVTHTWDEPFEDDYRPPLDFPFPSRGYPFEDYPDRKRVDDLEYYTETGQYEMWAWGVYTVIYDKDGTITSSGYRFTEHSSNITLLKAAFGTIMEELAQVMADYGGLMITETVAKGMNYE